MLSVDGFARSSARVAARASFFLKHVVAARGEVVHFDERNLDSSVVSFIAQCSLDVGPAGKRGGSTAGSAKTGFFSQRDKENAPLPFGGRAMGEIKLQLVYFLDVRSQLYCPLCSAP